MKNRSARVAWVILRAAVFATPFVIGMIGFLPLYNYNISQALFSAVRLYAGVVDIGLADLNLWLDIARWTALMMTASGVIIALKSSRTAALNFYKSFNKNSCAVYGNSAYAKHLVKDLGVHGIAATTEPIAGVRRHVLLFDSDEENLAFLIEHKDSMKDASISIKLDNIVAHSICGNDVTAFSMAENCARLYWREYPIEGDEKIGIVGFGALGQELFLQGLLQNIVSSKQYIEYHIWGESAHFEGLHHGLHNIDMDKIVFHAEDWQQGLPRENGFTRLVFCLSTMENLGNVSFALAYLNCEHMYVHVDKSERLQLFSDEDTRVTLTPFGMVDRLAGKEVVLMELLLRDAKLIHEEYCKQNPNEKSPSWSELRSFIKRSNISAADYLPVLRRLRDKGMTEDKLNELEHIRWCRLHYINNWSYAETRDDRSRQHNRLLPYDKLPTEVRERSKEVLRSRLLLMPLQ